MFLPRNRRVSSFMEVTKIAIGFIGNVHYIYGSVKGIRKGDTKVLI